MKSRHGLGSRRIHAAFLIALLSLAGCVAPRQELKPSKIVPFAADEAIRKILERNKETSSLKGMASVEVSYNGKDTNAKEVLVVKKPSKIRAETIGLFGNPVFILALDGPALSIHRPAENIFYKGNTSSYEMPLPFPLNEMAAEELTNLLLGGTSLINYGKSEVEFSQDERNYVLTLRSPNGFKRQVISLDVRTLRLAKTEIIDGERGIVVSAEFGDYQDIGTVSFPKEIKLRFANRSDALQIKYEDIELNAMVSDELFSLTPPEGSNKQ